MATSKRSAKIAIVARGTPIGWLSYASIVRNLKASYAEALGADARLFEYPRVEYRADLWALARELARFAPRRIVFLDQAPFQSVFLHAFGAALGHGKWPELVFHVDGDFTHRLREWLSVENLLRGKRCSFVCASPRHAELVRRFVKTSSAEAFPVVPFPVDTRLFRPSSKNREKLRRELGIRNDDFAWLYAGRVTLQKNVHLLVERFTRLLGSRDGARRHLLIVGPADHMSANYFGEAYPLCFYESVINKLFERLAPADRKRVHRISWAGARELAAVYNASDALVSLGLYHDEDFGLAAAEALACGARTLVTDWGGYAQFQERVRDAGALVPIALGSKGLDIDLRAFERQVQSLENDADTPARRARRAASLREFSSISAVAGQLRRLHAQPVTARFVSSAPLLRKLVFLFDSASGVFHAGPVKGGLYEDVYSSYLR